MRLPSDLRPATFVARLNRFTALVRLEEGEVLAHVANSGRLRELFHSGRPVLLAPRAGEHRKTAFDLVLVRLRHGLVSADARLPVHLVYEAFSTGSLPQFREYQTARREVPYGESRLDLVLTGGAAARCLIEVKSVTLVRNRRGLFPDAPTDRGRRHVRELMAAKREGMRAAAVFVIQRSDASSFAPHDEADPAFGETLRLASAAGVELYAYRCRVSMEEISITDAVPVLL